MKKFIICICCNCLFTLLLLFIAQQIQFYDYKEKEQLLGDEINEKENEFCPISPQQNTEEEINQNKEENQLSFQQPTYYDDLLDLRQFNYNGECQKYFKYKPNNKRDLVAYGLSYHNPSVMKRDMEIIIRSQSINQQTIGNATRIVFFYGSEPENGFIEKLQSFGLKVIRLGTNVPQGIFFNAAVERYSTLLSYLKKHQNEYDRVVISDFSDVIWFADGFACFSEDDMFITKECGIAYGNIECSNFRSSSNYDWLGKAFGYSLANLLKQQNSVVINVGFAAGGTKKMIQYLEKFNEIVQMNQNQKQHWGYDQAVINYLYYKNIITNLGIQVLEPSQFFAFDIFSGLDYNSTTKSLTIKGSSCSPIIRHKVEKDIQLTRYK